VTISEQEVQQKYNNVQESIKKLNLCILSDQTICHSKNEYKIVLKKLKVGKTTVCIASIGK